MIESCITCKLNKEPSSVLGGTIKEYNFWILQHIAGPVPVKGWLILKTKRHVEGIDKMSERESEELGLILNTLPKIQKKVLGAAKIYVCCFTEEVSHLHFHLIPRYPKETTKGPKIFNLLCAAKKDASKSIDVKEVIKIVDILKSELSNLKFKI